MSALPLPAVVIPAFQRPGAFHALLGMVARAHYPAGQPVPLHISLEHGHDPLVGTLAAEFPWPHGPKRVVVQPQRLGLRAHLLHCGDLTAEYGQVLILEDDLHVAPGYYRYAQAALAACAADPRVAGVGLYRYQLSEQHRLPFVPSCSPADDHYIQLPCSWGQVFSAAQWRAFRDWQQTQNEAQIDARVPAYIRAWGAQSWKRVFTAYLRAQDRYFLYPIAALCSHPGHAGTHADGGSIMQVPLEMGLREWHFAGLDHAEGIYDAWLEPHPDTLRRHCPDLAALDFSVDLYGQKEPEAWTGEWLLTTRYVLLSAQRYGQAIWPFAANVHHQQPGDGIRLARIAEVLPAPVEQRQWLAATPASVTAAIQALTGRDTPTFSIVLVVGPDTELPNLIVLNCLDQHPQAELVVVEQGEVNWAPGVLRHPRVRRLLAGSPDLGACIFQGMQAATGSWLLPLLPGQQIYPGVVRELSDILLQFPEVEWLACLPLPSRHTPVQALRHIRWDATQARLARPEKVLRSLQPGQIVVRRIRWRHIAESVAPGDWLGAMQALFSKTPLHIAQLWINKHPFQALPYTARSRQYPLPPGEGGLRGWCARLTRWAYLHDIPVLRQLHLALSHYPRVIRPGQGKGIWYRSEY